MQLQSKGRWYSWKRGLIERLGPDVEGIMEEVVEVCEPVRAVRFWNGTRLTLRMRSSWMK
jgi:hypothetical protein